MLHRFAATTCNRPKRALAVLISVGALALAVGGASTNRLTDHASDYLPPGSSVARAYHEVEQATGVDPEEGYVLLVNLQHAVVLDGPAPAPAMVRDTVRALRAQPGVRTVVDYWDNHDRGMVARDRRSTYVVADVGRLDSETASFGRLQRSIQASPALRGRVLIGGPTAAAAESTSQATRDLAFSEEIGIPVLLLLLAFLLRGFAVLLVPVLGSLFTIGLALSGMAAVGSLHPLSVFGLNVVVALGIGLSIDFSLLGVARFREELSRGAPPREAALRTLRTAGRATAFSATTIAGALGGLLAFPEPVIFSLAVAGMLAAASALVFSLVMLPALLCVLGRRLARPVLPGRAERSRRRWAAWAGVVARRPVRSTVGALALLVVLALPLAGLHFTGYSTSELPQGLSSAVVQTRLQARFAGATAAPVELLARAPATAAPSLTAYGRDLAHVRGVSGVSAPERLGHGLWQLDVSTTGGPLSGTAQHALSAIERAPAPFPVRAAGIAAEFRAELKSYEASLPVAALVAALVGLLAVFAMTGALVVALKTVLMSACSIAAAVGVVVYLFEHAWSASLLGAPVQVGIDSSMPIVLGALAFGLSTDYGVLLVARMKEALGAGLPSRLAVSSGLARTGAVLSGAALLFAVAIGALVLSQEVALKELGLGTAAAVLIDATVLRAVLMPALMALVGDWNWWAPVPLRRLYGRLGLGRLAPAGGPALLPERVPADAAVLPPLVGASQEPGF